jgi:hypothetical protein
MGSFKGLFFALVLSSSFLMAQDNGAASQDNSKDANGPVTVRGCVSRSSGDFILMKQDPGETFELHSSTHKIRLKNYLGQRVEVTGTKSPSLSTSSDAMRMGSAAPVTLTITSIKTLSKDCSDRPVN